MTKVAGIDLIEVARFRSKAGKSKQFLEKVFAPREIGYCRAFKDSAPHFAGIFAAKEAASKALGVEKYPFIELEIRHTKSGAPEVWHKNKKLNMAVSITHTATVAAAIALG